jgi:hypothetical protein
VRVVLADGWAAEELEEIDDMVLDVFMTVLLLLPCGNGCQATCLGCTVLCYLCTHRIFF